MDPQKCNLAVDPKRPTVADRITSDAERLAERMLGLRKRIEAILTPYCNDQPPLDSYGKDNEVYPAFFDNIRSLHKKIRYQIDDIEELFDRCEL